MKKTPVIISTFLGATIYNVDFIRGLLSPFAEDTVYYIKSKFNEDAEYRKGLDNIFIEKNKLNKRIFDLEIEYVKFSENGTNLGKEITRLERWQKDLEILKDCNSNCQIAKNKIQKQIFLLQLKLENKN